jgi:hypothetical protein
MLRPTLVFLAATLTALYPSRGTTQEDGAPVVLGAYRTVHSEILEEDGALQISLPRGYGESNLSYPAICLLRLKMKRRPRGPLIRRAGTHENCPVSETILV